MSTRLRAAVLGICVAVLVAACLGFVATRRAANQAAADDRSVDLTRSNTLVVRDLRGGASYSHLAQLDPAHPEDRTDSADVCVRVYAVRGHGVCLRPSAEAAGTFDVAFLDEHTHPTSSFPLVGVPSRTRISPDGRLFSWTVFVQGDSYNGGRFSTRSGTYDARHDDLVGTLEDWHITVEGKPYHAADLNFWGVTFAADDRTFYATMSTAGERYLVRGNLAAHTLATVHRNVECPSLSPDGSRIAFKKQIGRGWHFAVLDLTTGEETLLAEQRSIDDQLAWLDDETVLYGVRRDARHADVWSVPADGSGTPTLVVPDADSPASIR
ncbi:PD40 domain-containing protein [Nocardioides sp. AN3]